MLRNAGLIELALTNRRLLVQGPLCWVRGSTDIETKIAATLFDFPVRMSLT